MFTTQQLKLYNPIGYLCTGSGCLIPLLARVTTKTLFGFLIIFCFLTHHNQGTSLPLPYNKSKKKKNPNLRSCDFAPWTDRLMQNGHKHTSLRASMDRLLPPGHGFPVFNLSSTHTCLMFDLRIFTSLIKSYTNYYTPFMESHHHVFPLQ